MDPIKALLFDKDGTLFDFQNTWGVWAYGFFRDVAGDEAELAALHDALKYDPEAKRFHPESIAVAGTPQDIVTAMLPCLGDADAESLMRICIETSMTAPLSPAVPLDPFLSELRGAGYRLGVATNDTEAAARANLAQVKVDHHFEFIIGFDTGPTPKPAPDMVLAFAAHTGLAPSQIAMVGDSTHDLHAGRAAGAQTLAVLTGTALEAELAPFADAVFPDIGHIPNWLQSRRP